MPKFFKTKINPDIITAAHVVGESFVKSPFFVVPKNEKSTQEFEKRFLSKLPFYGIFPSYLQLIEHLLELENLKLQELAGESGSKTYGVFVQNELQFVVKTTEGQIAEIARDISSRELLKALDLKQATLTDLEAVGQYQIDKSDVTHTLLIQTAAKGKPLSSFIEDVVKVQDALKQSARAFAELHLKNHHLATPLTKQVQSFHFELFEKIIRRLTEDLQKGLKIGLTESQLHSIHQKIVDSIVGNWGLSGYSHGDSCLDHLFFEESSNRLTLIDTPSFLASIDSGRRPIGFSPYDFSWIWVGLVDYGFRAHLSSDQVQILQNTFKEEYERCMGIALPPLPARQIANFTKELYYIHCASTEQQASSSGSSEGLIDYLHRSILTDLDDK